MVAITRFSPSTHLITPFLISPVVHPFVHLVWIRFPTSVAFDHLITVLFGYHDVLTLALEIFRAMVAILRVPHLRHFWRPCINPVICYFVRYSVMPYHQVQ